jgi:ABC-2 type transport system ATP-binding protein|tara:strand:- start:263 stop:1186 length:924 start_codon:yes stop_codon:yes gene_type:complete
MMIVGQNLVRRYGSTIAVDDVSFEIAQGEVVGLLGHNGSGKTTIMKMLTGFLEPTAGQITLNGLDIGEQTRLAQACIGYLPENCPVWPDMHVADYLDYQACLHGLSPSERDSAVVRAIQRTGLKDRATQMIRTLSRGYRQRLGVAQAILHERQIVILDEPTNGLDPTQILEMRSLIKDLAKQSTILISTHILQEVQAVCERVLILRAGRLALDSRIEDLEQNQRLLIIVSADGKSVLGGIPGVERITQRATNDGLVHYVVDVSRDCASDIAQAIHAAGLKLHLLQPERQTLESVFAAVNEPQPEQKS